MQPITIDISTHPKAKEFAEKIDAHKKRKMEELRQEGLEFLKKFQSGSISPTKANQ